MEQQKQKEIEAELKHLYERYALEKRKPSGSETHAVRQRVCEKYRDVHVQNGLKAELWQLSERTLDLLRTPGLYPAPDRETVSKCMQTFVQRIEGRYFPEIDPATPFYLGPAGYVELNPREVVGPNEYFTLAQPQLVMNFGYPFHSAVPRRNARSGYATESVAERVLGINTSFFGALTGGDKRLGHDVVFYSPEAKFYFYDPVPEYYVPTTESKLRLGLSLAIQRQAAGLPVDQASIILNKFLSDAVLDHIMIKAKTLLAVEHGFFEGPNAKARLVAEDATSKSISSTVKAFIESQIAVDETNVLTISECVAQLQSFCQERGESLPSYKEVKVVVQMKMREVYGKGLRNDLLLEDNRCVAGWKGLRVEKASEIRKSADPLFSSSDARTPIVNGQERESMNVFQDA